MEILISSVGFSDYLNESPYMNNRKWEIHRNHVNFLKEKLELWMFVPCKLVDSVWEPIKGKKNHFIRKELDEFREADKIVLFEGFELNQKDLSKLENIICITKNKIQVTFFKRENSVFFR